jgi:hypothetical protein
MYGLYAYYLDLGINIADPLPCLHFADRHIPFLQKNMFFIVIILIPTMKLSWENFKNICLPAKHIKEGKDLFTKMQVVWPKAVICIAPDVASINL